jgi:hypothetical protein
MFGMAGPMMTRAAAVRARAARAAGVRPDFAPLRLLIWSDFLGLDFVIS